jgi:hypothetical protein
MNHSFSIQQFGDVILMHCYQCGRTYELAGPASCKRWNLVSFWGSTAPRSCDDIPEATEEDEEEQ